MYQSGWFVALACSRSLATSSSVDPMSNSPGGISMNFMPIVFVISTGTPRYLAQAVWCSLALTASNGAMAGGGEPAGSAHGGTGFVAGGVVAGAAGFADGRSWVECDSSPLFI